MKHRILFGWLILLLAGLGAGGARAQAPRWLNTNSWTGGAGVRQTEPVWLNGESWLLRHTHSGAGELKVEVYDGAGKLFDTPVKTRRPFTGVSYIRGRGQYYLRVSAPAAWTLDLDQKLSLPDEWHLIQLIKAAAPRKPATILATWTGEQGVATYDLTVAAPRWKVKCYNLGDGQVRFSVQDRNSNAIELDCTSRTSEEFEGWIHHPGEFLVKADAFNSEWKIEVSTE
ncbi:MAG: hypothetical protein WC789_09850 [Lentisphaeria bacterium]|jgi:hypothetical protein